MCGIAGACDATGVRIDAATMAAMIAMVRHRGPDDCGIYVGQGVGLANARLSIIDIAGGHQPLCNEDKSLWITFNGEIFNYVELRNELLARGHRFATHSDTEVVIHLYEEYGENCVSRLNGQWGFAIWDVKQHKLFLSRDRLGVRPLFYTLAGSTLLFGSEIKSIFAHPAAARDLDIAALGQIFTFWCTIAPRTIFKHVRELPPGHSLTFSDGELAVKPYWQLNFGDAEPVNHSEEEYSPELYSLLMDATRIRLRADVPVGAYLSGGLDSTIITALIKEFANTRLQTFSVSFSDNDLDESAFQRQAVDFLNTEHQEVHCQYDDIAAVFPDVIWHAETPIIRAAPAPLYLLSEAVRASDYKVVLTGEGADELFGGYDIYKEAKIRRFWAFQPGSALRPRLLRRLYPYQQNLHRQPDAYLQAFFRVSGGDVNNAFFSHLPRWKLTSEIKLFLCDAIRAELSPYDALDDLAARLPVTYFSWPGFCQAQYLETIFLLPGYILSSQGDRVAMAHAVEARHPFLDYRVVEFAAKLPPAMKMKALNEKYILKKTFGAMLPPSIVRRPKQPYRAPDGRSFVAGRVPEYVKDLLSPSAVRATGVFNGCAVSTLLDKFRAGRAIGVKDNMALIAILSTQLLADQFISHFRQRGESCREWKTICAVS